MSMFSMTSASRRPRGRRSARTGTGSRPRGRQLDLVLVGRLRGAPGRRDGPAGRRGARGCSVLTRPSMISGKPVKSRSPRTSSPAARARRRAAGGEELDAELARRGELDDAALVGDRQQRARESDRARRLASWDAAGCAVDRPRAHRRGAPWNRAALGDEHDPERRSGRMDAGLEERQRHDERREDARQAAAAAADQGCAASRRGSPATGKPRGYGTQPRRRPQRRWPGSKRQRAARERGARPAGSSRCSIGRSRPWTSSGVVTSGDARTRAAG